MSKNPKITIPNILEAIQDHLNLSSQTERDLLEEIESHLEDALAAAIARGEDETAALLKVAETFGVDDIGQALQDVHAPWESADAIIACALPVLATLILRWLVFAPDGSAIAWQVLLMQPAFWFIAIVVLIIPIVQFQQWRHALVSWGFFWSITIIMIYDL